MKGVQALEQDCKISIHYILITLNSNLSHLGRKSQRHSSPLYNSPDQGYSDDCSLFCRARPTNVHTYKKCLSDRRISQRQDYVRPLTQSTVLGFIGKGMEHKLCM